MPKFNKREALKGTIQTRKMGVKIAPTSDGERVISFVFVSDDNSGVRFDWGSGEYYNEILDVDGANLDRLKTFFKDHVRSVDSAVGKIGNKRVEGGQILGDVTFGTDVDSDTVYRKYNEEILTDVSIGYEIRDYKVEQGAENERDNVTVTDFDIFEVSAVGIGFDSGAKKRSEENLDGSSIMNEKELERLAQLEAMSKRNKEEVAELQKLEGMRKADVDTKVEAERVALKAENAELKRKAEVGEIARAQGEVGLEILNANEGIKPDALRTKILEKLSAPTEGGQTRTDEQNDRGAMIDAMVDGLAMRVGAKIEKPHAGAEAYRHASLVSIGNALLPESERSFNPSDTAERSLLSGDFPLLLQSVGARVLTAEFEAQTGTFKAWMKETDVPDFRVMSDLTASVGGGRLDKTLENGDLKELSANEKAESWKIETFGNKFVLTRQMIINDDLGNFTNLIQAFSRMAMTTANGISYDLLQNKGDYANYKMADGSGIWIAGRLNTSAVALTSEALSAGKLAMSKHKAIDGKTPLNIVPKYLIVSPALEVTAKEILGAISKLGADNVNVPNVNQNGYTLIVDPEIESDTAWYLLADYRTLKMGYLSGTNRSPVTKMNDSTIARTVYEGVFDIGVMVEDYRGLFRGNV